MSEESERNQNKKIKPFLRINNGFLIKKWAQLNIIFW